VGIRVNSSDDAPDAELVERYREASRADALAPRDAVRAAILEEGRRAAAGFAESSSLGQRRRPSRWKMTAFATAATVLLVAVVIAPRLWEKDHPGTNAGGFTNPFKQAAVRKAQPDPAEYASTPPVPVVPVQPSPAPPPRLAEMKPPTRSVPEPPPVHYPEQSVQISALSQRNAAAQSSSRAFARRQDASGALLAAVSSGDPTKAAQLLDQATFVDERDEAGRTPLMLAVAGEQLDMVRLLLAHGADPNAADLSGLTPLKQAQQKGYAEIAAELTQAGAR
jgi:hypothetical protein